MRKEGRAGCCGGLCSRTALGLTSNLNIAWTFTCLSLIFDPAPRQASKLSPLLSPRRRRPGGASHLASPSCKSSARLYVRSLAGLAGVSKLISRNLACLLVSAQSVDHETLSLRKVASSVTPIVHSPPPVTGNRSTSRLVAAQGRCRAGGQIHHPIFSNRPGDHRRLRLAFVFAKSHCPHHARRVAVLAFT